MKKSGFTLIELLVTITLLAVVSSIGFVTYSKAQITARDARRKQDLRSIAVALELYYQVNKRYPCSGVGGHNFSTALNFWITDTNSNGGTGCTGTALPLNKNYINAMPIDPINTGNPTASGTYGYAYSSPPNADIVLGAGCPAGQGQYYILRTKLENTADPDACLVKAYKRCEGSALCPGSDTPSDPTNSLFVITSQ